MSPEILYAPLGDNPPKAMLYYGQNVLKTLRELPSDSIQVICTSPPYYGLRNYGTEHQIWGGDPLCEHRWGEMIPQDSRHIWTAENSTKEGRVAGVDGYPKERGSFCTNCAAWKGELGSEPTPQLFTQHLVIIFQELRRVLRPDGIVWLNLGDSYCASPRGNLNPGGGNLTNSNIASTTEEARWKGAKNLDKSKITGLKQKDLIGIPWRVAFALQEDGWWLRSDIIWEKVNCLPEAVTDRPTKSHEYIFMLTKSAHYFYDHIAIREPHSQVSIDRQKRTRTGGKYNSGNGGQPENSSVPSIILGVEKCLHPDGRNKRSVWTIPTKAYPGAHFACWPEALVEPMIKASTSEKGCCPHCGAPWKRLVQKQGGRDWHSDRMNPVGFPGELTGDSAYKQGCPKEPLNNIQSPATIEWQATCSCPEHNPIPCTVLDPFSGSATTGLVALKLGRDYKGIDLNPDYLSLAKARIRGESPVDKKIEEDSIEFY